jgi:AbrB family looped-hinge helix DNA binding protein
MNPTGKLTMPLVRVKQKFQVTLPAEVHEELQLEEGDLLEATVRDNEIILKPMLPPEEREAIDIVFEEGMQDYREGRGAGPFNTAEELQAYLDTLKTP